MRGEGAPSPIYEGEDSVIAWMLDGPDAVYHVPLPEPGEAKRAIMDSFTKEHSAEYQSQALIDLAFRMRERIPDLEQIEKIIIHTSHHTHYVIGTGANDPQKMDPKASRETLDHSIMYIFAVALQDGRWHHVDSYKPRRAARARYRGAVAQDRNARGPGVDPPLPFHRSERAGLRRARRGPDARRQPNRSTNWRWPTRTRSARSRSRGRTTSASSRRSPTGSSRRGRPTASWRPRRICRGWPRRVGRIERGVAGRRAGCRQDRASSDNRRDA